MNVHRRWLILMAIVIFLGIGGLVVYLVLPKGSTTQGIGDTAYAMSPKDIATWVGTHYGDIGAKVVHVTETESDSSPGEHIYLMSIEGNFHYKNQTARYLSFSALVGKKYVWNIYGSSVLNRPGDLWEMELGTRPK